MLSRRDNVQCSAGATIAQTPLLSLVGPSTVACMDAAQLMLRDAQEWTPETLAAMPLKSPTRLLLCLPNNKICTPPFSPCSLPNQSHMQVHLIDGIQASHLYPCCKGIWESQFLASTWRRGGLIRQDVLQTLEECSKSAGQSEVPTMTNVHEKP